MKTLIISAIILSALIFSANAGINNSRNNEVSITDTAQQSPLSQLLTLYYDIKNSLVNSNANLAAAKAGEFTKAIGSIEMKTLADTDMKALMAVQDKLTEDAQHIAGTKDLGHQRELFTTFSNNMITLAKGAKLSAQPVYEAYCPMKKASWLTNDKVIKNPYFGSTMLTCGKVTGTLQ